MLMNTRIFSFEEMFANGIKRSPGELDAGPNDGLILNLGSGRAPMAGKGVVNLDLPAWKAPSLEGFADTESVSEIHMYHFLEHLSPDDGLEMLRECQRVLVPRGVVNIVVPHAMSPLAYQAPDHRTFWTEEGLQDTFYSAGYDTTFGGTPWEMDITWMMIAGVKFSNLCVLAQLTKRLDNIPYRTPWRRDGN